MERQKVIENSHRFEKRGESKSESCDRCNVHHPSVRPACLPALLSSSSLSFRPSVRPTAPRSRGPTPSITLDPHSDKSNLNVDGARQWGEQVHICTGQEQGGSAGLCGQITTFFLCKLHLQLRTCFFSVSLPPDTPAAWKLCRLWMVESDGTEAIKFVNWP